MSSKWTKATIADVLELVIDHRGKTPKKLGFDDFHCSGYPVLSAKHVKTSGLTSLDSIRYANESMYNKWMKVPLQKGDVILTSEAPMGETYYIDGSVQYLLGQRVFGLRPKQELIEPLYLLSWLSSQVGQSKLKERATGSTVQGIKQSELLKVEIELPPLFVQRAIAVNQSSISEKIQLNSKINQTLEQMAQAIFKSWFVDFEPVKAKIAALEVGGSEDDALLAAMQAIAGSTLFATDAADADAPTQLARLQTEHPEQYATLRATAELFPSAMQESELGEIPEGWSVCQVENILERLKPVKRYTKKEVSSTGLVPVFEQGADILLGFHNEKAGFTADAKNPAFVFGDHTCITHLSCQDFDISQNVIPLRGRNRSTIWVYYAIQGKQAFQEYRRHWSELIVKPVIYPTRDICERYSETVLRMICFKESLERENRSLAELRDTLLPKLLSGEIDVSALADNTEANA